MNERRRKGTPLAVGRKGGNGQSRAELRGKGANRFNFIKLIIILLVKIL